MDTSNLTNKEKLLILSALDDTLVHNYDVNMLEDVDFNLLETELIKEYKITKENGTKKVEEIKDDLIQLRDQLVKETL